jgi:hypothetical protein
MSDKLKRVETGVIQFEDDWPGVFIRGDDAYYYASELQDLLEAISHLPNEVKVRRRVLDGLADLLRSCNITSAYREIPRILELKDKSV